MKKYFLLRDNRETGPFKIEDLKELKLKLFDLIWIDGESKGWSYPNEIKELENFICKDQGVDNLPDNRNQSNINHGKSRVFVSLPKQFTQTSTTFKTTDHLNNQVALETKYAKPLDEIKEMYVNQLNNKKQVFKSTFQKPNALWLVGLFASLVLGAFTIKKVVNGLDDDFYNKTATSAAIIPVEEYKQQVTNLPIATEAIAFDTVEEKPKTVKKINLTKLVNIEKKDFTVGVFGGINNLKLTLHNSSPYEIDKVEVEVEYLKPNGDVIKKEKVQIFSLNPENSKTISVPPSKRGVDVKASVTKVSSKKYKAALLQL